MGANGVDDVESPSLLGTLDADVFLEITRYVSINSSEDLRNLSLTCKSLRDLTKPSVFKSIHLPVFLKRRQLFYVHAEWKRICDLVGPYVRSLSFKKKRVSEPGLHSGHLQSAYLNKLHKFYRRNLKELQANGITEIISALPALRLLVWDLGQDIPQGILDELQQHQAKPLLHLVDDNCIQLDRLCVSKCLSALGFSMSASGRDERKLGEPLLVAQKVIMSNPNLRSLSLRIHYPWGGCVRSPLSRVARKFSTDIEPRFPPLEELTLSDYRIDEEDWPYWRDNFQWQCLVNLTLKHSSDYILERMAGKAESLRRLEMVCFPDQTNYCDKSVDIDKFLRSFNSLESVHLEGYTATPEALAHHSKLSKLHVHVAESRSPEKIRPVFSTADLKLLGQKCPKIKDLSIDVHRERAWPYKIFDTVALSFPRLERVSMHFELGIENIDSPIQPIVNHDSAKHIFRHICTERESKSLPQLLSCTFITGEKLRRFPQWTPMYGEWERALQAEIQIRSKRDSCATPKTPELPAKEPYLRISQPLFSAEGHRVYWYSPECTVFAGGRFVAAGPEDDDLEIYRMDLNWDRFRLDGVNVGWWDAEGKYEERVRAGVYGAKI
ncbi:hypothetical protein AJ79_07211 [Helicocarpus griseus UAMH5409]|uniref:F-box domain-containing protein n=1 Tax=Helicocarpus griseus UAMH5409 TaxID=1447875 RepID=A0A2B7X514_9EURO|nr:hypothetical protein AJ79_07211 [Helicocarpus griseus UAMH5409]